VRLATYDDYLTPAVGRRGEFSFGATAAAEAAAAGLTFLDLTA